MFSFIRFAMDRVYFHINRNPIDVRFIYFILCVNVLLIFIYVYYLCGWYKSVSEEGIWSPGIGIIDGYEEQCWPWESNLGPPQG